MKFKKSLIILAILPLASCSWFKKDLVIPTIDVDKLNKTIKLPTLPTRNQGAVRSSGGYDYIDVYEMSDFHGAVNAEVHSDSCYIGLPKLATYLDNRRLENPGGTVLLSSGDMFQGSAESNLTRGYMVNYSMQYMGFDAMCIGNHEFDWTDTWIKKNAELKYGTYQIPFLGANIYKNGSIPSFLKKSTVLTRGDYKIGVIGVMGNGLEYSILKTAIKDYTFKEYQSIVSTEAARLKDEVGCNAVVMLAHEAGDAIVPPTGIDAIFGGHAHEDYNSGDSYPIPILATENYGKSIAHVSLKFDSSTNELVGFEDADIYAFESSDLSSLSDEAGIKKIMNQYAPEINKIKNIKLGKCDGTLKIQTALKNIATASMFDSAVNSAKNMKELKVDSKKIVASFTNVNGGIRSDIEKGEIKYGDVYRSFPFDNEIVLLKVKGSKMKNDGYLLAGFGCYRLFEDSSYFKNSETYYIATTDYVALSDMMAPFQEVTDKDMIRTGKIMRDEIANKIYKTDNVKVSKWNATGDYHYESISPVF